MNNSDLKNLDNLREEKKNLDYFLLGNGNLKIKFKIIGLRKFFGAGHHEFEVKNRDLSSKILKILSNRLHEINEEISRM